MRHPDLGGSEAELAELTAQKYLRKMEYARKMREQQSYLWLKQAQELHASLESQRNPEADLLKDKQQRKLMEAIVYLKSTIQSLQWLYDNEDAV